MSLLYIVLPAAIVLSIAYVTYGSLLAKLFKLDPNAPTPAEELNDGLDYEPIPTSALLPQHFSAIAAAGPIVGPIVAGLAFGWLPALIWILIGSVLIGGVHDFAALVASIRHRARSIAEVVRDNMSRTSYLLFLSFIWIALVYIIVAFTDITAGAFVSKATEEAGNVTGGAVATSSILYLILPLVMGLLMRYAKLSLTWATIIFLPLVAAAIWVGPFIPLETTTMFLDPADYNEETRLTVRELKPSLTRQDLSEENRQAIAKQIRELEEPAVIATAQSRKLWDVLLLVYCLLAGVAPVWLLLQPRGHLGGYFLYAALGAGALGLMFGGATAQYDMFIGWDNPKARGGITSLFPALFIMIACGACSGFHSLIASGTTSKQLKRETDAKPIAYGSMLLEAMVAIVSLCCVMMFAKGAPELSKDPNQIYAAGIRKFMEVISTNPAFARFAESFALMAFTTFVYDTLDVCTRLGRYILQELTGRHDLAGKVLGTVATAGVPLLFLLGHPSTSTTPVWQIFWNLFGASNQLLAALTLLGVTVWLWRSTGAWWVWLVTGVPTVWMYTMSIWALGALTYGRFQVAGPDGVKRFELWVQDPVPYIGIVLMSLAIVMLVEGIRVLLFAGPTATPPAPKPAPVGA